MNSSAMQDKNIFLARFASGLSCARCSVSSIAVVVASTVWASCILFVSLLFYILCA